MSRFCDRGDSTIVTTQLIWGIGYVLCIVISICNYYSIHRHSIHWILSVVTKRCCLHWNTLSLASLHVWFTEFKSHFEWEVRRQKRCTKLHVRCAFFRIFLQQLNAVVECAVAGPFANFKMKIHNYYIYWECIPILELQTSFTEQMHLICFNGRDCDNLKNLLLTFPADV